MRCDCLRLARPLQHEELRENSNRLEEDGERPQNLREAELVVEDEGEDEAGADEVFNLEGINRGVVCWTVSEMEDERGETSGGLERRLTGICIS